MMQKQNVNFILERKKSFLVTADKGSLINLTSVIQYVLKLSDLHLSQNKILQNLMVSDHLRLPRVLVFRSNFLNKRLQAIEIYTSNDLERKRQTDLTD